MMNIKKIKLISKNFFNKIKIYEIIYFFFYFSKLFPISILNKLIKNFFFIIIIKSKLEKNNNCDLFNKNNFKNNLKLKFINNKKKYNCLIKKNNLIILNKIFNLFFLFNYCILNQKFKLHFEYKLLFIESNSKGFVINNNKFLYK